MIEDQRIWGRGNSPFRASNLEFKNSSFEQCHIDMSTVPGRWNHISKIDLFNVGQWNCSIDTSAIEDVHLHNLKRIGDAPLFLSSCVFRNVKLSGRISALKINRRIGLSSSENHLQSQWDKAVREYYCAVDWALDLTEASFQGGITFEAIPGRLIRRNPASQVLILRENLEIKAIENLDFDETAIDIGLNWFWSDSIFDSIVVAARDTPKWASRDRAVLQMLRAEGIAEAD